MEQLFNLYSSTLSADYTAGTGRLTVTSTSGLASGPTFSVTVLDQTTLAVKVVLTVSNIVGSTLWVTAEGSDQNCVSGDIIVAYVLTARSLPAVLEDWLGFGSTANLPSTTGRKSGQRYKVTDGVFEYILDDGTENSPATSALWVPYFRGIQTAIPNQSFSWINQNGASITTEADGSLYLAGTSSASANVQCRVFTAPATPYKYKILLTPLLPTGTFAHAGILFSDGTKISEVDVIYDTNDLVHLSGAHYNSATSFSAALTLTPSGGYQHTAGLPLVLGLSDDGTNRKFFWYPDGYTEIQLFSESRTNFLTATEIGFFYDDNGASKGGGVIVHGILRTV